MRRILLWFVLPVGVLATLGLLCAHGVQPAEKNSEWTESLRAAAAGADRLVVQDMDWQGKGCTTNYEIRGARELLRGLLDLVEIDAAGSGFHCMCDGQYWIHVYRADREVATIGYHHGRSLRWHDGKWKGDALLTPASQKSPAALVQGEGISCLAGRSRGGSG